MEKDTVRDDVKKSIQGLMWQGHPKSKNVENRQKEKKSETRVKAESAAEVVAANLKEKMKSDSQYEKEDDEQTKTRINAGLNMPGDRATGTTGAKGLVSGVRKSIEDAEKDLMRRNTEEQQRYTEQAKKRGDKVATLSQLKEAEKRVAAEEAKAKKK